MFVVRYFVVTCSDLVAMTSVQDVVSCWNWGLSIKILRSWRKARQTLRQQLDQLLCYTHISYNTSSTAQGGGRSFKNRKPIGEGGCCDSGMAERTKPLMDWKVLDLSLSVYFFSLFLSVSLSFSDYLPTYLSIYLSISLSLRLSIELSLYLSVYLPICLSICLCIYPSFYLSWYLTICLCVYVSICLSIYLSIYLAVSLSICLSVSLSIYLSICLSFYLSV